MCVRLFPFFSFDFDYFFGFPQACRGEGEMFICVHFSDIAVLPRQAMEESVEGLL